MTAEASGDGLPLLTTDVPGTGGVIEQLEDFFVEELPAYLPCGSGEHCLVFVQKRDLTTPQMLQRLCAALGLDARAAGYAGLKDRRGVTQQWVSLQGVQPERVLAVKEPKLQVLSAGLHRNKLKTGHLRGNRFRIVLRQVSAGALERARQVLDVLAQQGLPNYFGAQRFGRQGDNAAQGLRLLRGELVLPSHERFKRRLLISALQSELFNEVLAARVREGLLHRLLGGEVLQRCDSSACFVSALDQLEHDAQRLAAREVVITGPIAGPRMPLPAAGSPALAREMAVLERHGVTPAEFSRLGRLARGGRRPLSVPVREATVEATPVGGLELSFVLPPGAYATVLLGEIAKAPVRPAAFEEPAPLEEPEP